MNHQIHATQDINFKPATYPLTGTFTDHDGSTYEMLLAGWETLGTEYQPVFTDTTGPDAGLLLPADQIGDTLTEITDRFPRRDIR